MKGLTHRQHAVLAVIKRSIEDHGYPPTIREIGKQMGIASNNGVNDHLLVLQKKGFITRADTKARGIQLVKTQPASAPPVTSPMTTADKLEEMGRDMLRLAAEMRRCASA